MSSSVPSSPGDASMQTDQELSDATLIEAARRGSILAFQSLFERYSKLTYRRVVRLMGENAEVDDVVQDVFIQVHKSLHRFDTRLPFPNWLYRVIRNVTYSHLRKRTAIVDPHDIAAFGASTDDWSRLSARDRVRGLDRALQSVKPEAREAFVLYAVEGLTLQEIADMTDCSINTIAARVRRTRERLRDLLEAQELEARAGGVS